MAEPFKGRAGFVSVDIIGDITQDPELGTFEKRDGSGEGVKYMLKLACNKVNDQHEIVSTQWAVVVLWGQVARTAAASKLFRKGVGVRICDARWSTREYDGKFYTDFSVDSINQVSVIPSPYTNSGLTARDVPAEEAMAPSFEEEPAARPSASMPRPSAFPKPPARLGTRRPTAVEADDGEDIPF